MTYRPYFIKAIRKAYPLHYNEIESATDKHYASLSVDTQFATRSANPMDKRLDFAAYFLAFIKTLDERRVDYETIRSLCLAITADYVRPKNWFQRVSKKMPARLIKWGLMSSFIDRLDKRISINDHTDGFIATIVKDKAATYGLGYGVDILQCGICKLFAKHNYHRYASILCEVDKLTSALAGLNLHRTGTIANGAGKCDFRWSKME